MHRVFLTMALGLFAVGLAHAYPTLVGPTGLVVLPDARPAAARFAAAVSVVDNANNRGIPLRAVARLGAGELGAVFINDDIDSWGLNGKVPVYDRGPITVAAGAVCLANDDFDTQMWYVAATGDPLPRVSATLGATWTRIASDAGSADAVRPYAGLRISLPTGRELVAEYQASSDTLFEDDAISSVMLVRRHGSLYTSQIGVTNALGLLGTTDHVVFAGVALDLGR